MGLAKETIFTTKSPSSQLCSLKANITFRKKRLVNAMLRSFFLLLIVHFSDSYFAACCNDWVPTGFPLTSDMKGAGLSRRNMYNTMSDTLWRDRQAYSLSTLLQTFLTSFCHHLIKQSNSRCNFYKTSAAK